MKDFKTTISGILAGIVLAGKSIWPEYDGILNTVAAALVAVLGIFAAQERK